MPTAAVLGSRAAVVAVTGPLGTESVRSNPSRRHDDAQVRRPGSGRLRRLLYRQHSPQRELYASAWIKPSLSPHAIRQSMTLSRKQMSRTHQIDHWLAPDFAGAIMFDEGDAVQHAAGHEFKCRAHDNLNAIPQAASVADMAAA